MLFFLYLHPSLQHSPFIWKWGHMKVPMNFTQFMELFPWKVFSHILPLAILNSEIWSSFLIVLLFVFFLLFLSSPLCLHLPFAFLGVLFSFE